MTSESGIYVIINTINGNTYVGSAVDFQRRWKVHKRDLRKQRHHSSYLQNAWNKYGEECFRFTVERWCEVNDLLAAEQEVIDLLKPEYNMSPNAGISQRGVVRTQKFKDAVRTNNHNRARKYNGMTVRELIVFYKSTVPKSTVEMRITRGWDPAQAATTPVIPHTETREGKKRK